ncbi:hypothetical protein Glove_180g80 [Diversispora epigaea]|uniref:RNA polymerase II elongation factor ELL N-terminal domain-containing protein n=1 Tax=Diversispora epigaea TaxID=1348612 RepID=A0A397IN31_9GLOM|nr:hypothetical protein Glove_180g80 [Diversispora epigaea]
MGKNNGTRGSRNGGSSTRGGELYTTKQGGVHKNITTATVARAKGRGKTTRGGGGKVELADDTTNANSSTAVAAPEVDEMEIELEKELEMELGKVNRPTKYILGGSPFKKCIGLKMSQSVLKKIIMAGDKNMKIKFSNGIHISLGKKEILSFKTDTTVENSIIFEKNGDQMDIIGKMIYQAKSTDQTNSNAKLDRAKRNLKIRQDEIKREKEKKKVVMLTNLQPDPDVVKPKGKSVIKKSIKRNDESSNVSKVVTYIRPGHPPPEVSIGNSNEPGIPLIKRVTHLIAIEDLNTEQIAMKVRDSILNVEQILNENAILQNGIWELKSEMWLKLDPYNFKPYNSSQIAKVVQKMNNAADELGFPADAPERPHPPKPKLPINFSTGESSQKYDSGTLIIPAENSHQSFEGRTTRSSGGGKTIRGGGGKPIRGGRGNRGRGVKTTTTTTNNIIPTLEDQPVTNSTRGRRGRPKNSTRGVKTTNANQKTNSSNSSTMETTASVEKIASTMTTSTSSSITSKSTTTTTTSTIITTVSKDNKDNISPADNKITQQNKYRVETLNSYRELYSHFNHQVKIYEEIDASLIQYVSKAKEILTEIHNARSSMVHERKLEKVINMFGESSKCQEEIKTFYELQDDLKKVIEECNRAAKEGVSEE